MESISKIDEKILKIYIHLSGTINNFMEAKCYYYFNPENQWDQEGNLTTSLKDEFIEDMIEEKFNNFNGLKIAYREDISLVEVFKLGHLEEVYKSEGWQSPIHYFNISDNSPVMKIPHNINDETKEDLIGFLENTITPALSDMKNDGRFSKDWLESQSSKIKNILIQLK